jgi:hypothetical protein
MRLEKLDVMLSCDGSVMSKIEEVYKKIKEKNI